ncbi:MAG TPA: hypothetical protein VHD88_06555, partial [Pyrinomonadaceae bacterium]|nr:hypothetical protein [Pyrinomonadaceae bacterium]
ESEILSTLDEKGTLENLPFMPEMLRFCGRQFRVSRQAFKTCVDDADMRQLENAVFLEDVRCDGASHGGCARACLVFWKTAWLKPIGSPDQNNGLPKAKLTAEDLISMATREGEFFCQSSEIINASKPLPWWEPRQYLWDLKYNRIPTLQFARSLFIAFYNKLASRLKLASWGLVAGSGDQSPTTEPLNLRAGELVRVRSLSEIKATLDSEGKHQNLLFAPAMAHFCGSTLQVRDRVETIVLEATPRQRKIKDTVLLEGATCDGVCHRMCPRQSLLFWRECWLERVKAA